MLKFHQWLAEAPKKKKVTKEPKHTTTVVQRHCMDQIKTNLVLIL
jgi:hypothetical protein